MWRIGILILTALALTGIARAEIRIKEFKLPEGAGPHDVAPGTKGEVWYTAQSQGALGRLDPATGEVRQIPLGPGSRPHGVIVGPDGAPWITDSGLNAILRVDPADGQVTRWPLPVASDVSANRNANLNTATFDKRGTLWFTGQNGVYGMLEPASGGMRVFDAPRGRGPYGIATTPDGAVYYASLAGNHIARIDVDNGNATPIDPPTPAQGARRVWSDSRSRVWVSEWLSGQVSRYDPKDGSWQSWKLPGTRPRVYAVYVDEADKVWLSDFGGNAMVRFDPATGKFDTFPSPRPNAGVRQILGRPGEVWAPESGTDHLVVFYTR